MAKTDHSADIEDLRARAEGDGQIRDIIRTAADLLEMHDRQSFSLDNWTSARRMVENMIGHPIQENHV